MNYPVMTGALPNATRDAMGNPVGAAGVRGHHYGLARTPAYPAPSTGAISMQGVKDWLDKPGPGGYGKNMHWAIGGTVVLAGLAYYGSKNFWF